MATRTEQKSAWNRKTYKQYVVRFRYDTDSELIDFIEKNRAGISISDFLKSLVEDAYKKG